MTALTAIDKVLRLHAPGSVGIEQMLAARRSYRLAILASAVNALIVAMVLSREQNSLFIWGSFALLLTISGVRLLHAKELTNLAEQSPENQLRWQRWFVLGVLAVGLWWSLMIMQVGPGLSLDALIVMIVVTAGMAAGSTASYSSLLPACFAYVVPVGITALIRLPAYDGSYQFELAVMTLLFFVMISIIARQHSGTVTEAFDARRQLSTRTALLEHTQNELQQREAMLEAVFQQASMMVFVTDNDGRVLLAIGRGFETIGLDPVDTLGRSLSSVFGDRHSLLELQGNVCQHRDKVEATVQLGDSYFDVLAAPFDEPEQTGALFIGVDVTEQTRFRRLQEQFVSNINHQLRTPLTPLRGALDLLLLEVDVAAETESQRELINMAIRNVERLQTITEQIATLDRLEHPQPASQPEWVDTAALERITLAAFEALEPVARREKPLRLINRADGWQAKFNAEAVDQLLRALLDNACRHALEKTPIEVSVTPKRKNLVVAVVNYGLAIEASIRQVLFDRFSSSQSSDSRRSYGFGLGLHVAQRIAEQHGGRLWLERSDGQRTEFRFSLPARQTHDQTEWEAAMDSGEKAGA